jgi:beta-galactosidase
VLTLTARARGGAATSIPGGHLVAWDQFVLPSPPGAAEAIVPGPVKLDDRRAAVTLSAAGITLRVDRTTGLVDYRDKDRSILSGGAPNFYRALTDNDIGTGVEKTHDVWKTASAKRNVELVTVERAAGGAVAVRVRFTVGDGSARFESEYRMRADGSVAVEAAFNPSTEHLPDPLRVGLAFSMPADFKTLEWYGKGPHESYIDRQAGAALGRWTGTIAEQNHDYMRPQETGNKVGVRWLAVSGAALPTLTVRGAQSLSANVLAFPYDDLSRRPPGTRRSSDIVPHGPVSVLIDAVQSGLGGTDAWSSNGRPLLRYRVPVAPLRYAFTLSLSPAGPAAKGARAATATQSPDVF